MKEKAIGLLKKYWLPSWCALMILSVCSLMTSALYDSSTSSMKRVVRSTSDQGKMFSSSILLENGSLVYVSKYFQPLEDQTDTYDVDVYLWNYSLKNLFQFYPTGIDYKMKFTLSDMNGTDLSVPADLAGKSVQIVRIDDNKNEDDPGYATVMGTLGEITSGDPPTYNWSFTSSTITLGSDAQTEDQHHYVLRFSGNWDLDNDMNICVRTEAELEKGGDSSKYTDISNLGATIGLKKAGAGESNGWEAYIAEDRLGKTTAECDAYNLVVTGSGREIITIKWDTTKLECNKNFCLGTIYEFGKYLYVDGTQANEVEYSTEGTVATLVIRGDTGNPLYKLDEDISAAVIAKEGDYTVTRSGSEDSYSYTFTNKEDGTITFPTTGNYNYTLGDKTFKTYGDLTAALDAITDFGESVTVAAQVNRLDNRNRYDLQFYKKPGTDPENWSFFDDKGSELSGTIWLSAAVVDSAGS